MISALSPSRRLAATRRANHLGHQDTGLIGSGLECLSSLRSKRGVAGVLHGLKHGFARRGLAPARVGRPVLVQQFLACLTWARHDIGNGAVRPKGHPHRLVEWLGPIHGSVVHGGIEFQIGGRQTAFELSKLSLIDVVVFAGNQHARLHSSIREEPRRHDDALLMGTDCSGLRGKPRSMVRHNATSLTHNAIQRGLRVSVAGRAA